jgi:hypothetical protein
MYKISVCWFPGNKEIEATWEKDGEEVMVTFPVDDKTGYRLSKLVPCCAYHDAEEADDNG